MIHGSKNWSSDSIPGICDERAVLSRNQAAVRLMTDRGETHLRLEIGHVVFIDIVGYSKLLLEEQKEKVFTCQ